MRVLLIEDDATVPRALVQALQSSGTKLDRTDNTEDALEMARHYDYDIVVLDNALPDIDGFEVVRRMRAARVDTPILILSGVVRHGRRRLHHQALRHQRASRPHAGDRPTQQGLQPADDPGR